MSGQVERYGGKSIREIYDLLDERARERDEALASVACLSDALREIHDLVDCYETDDDIKARCRLVDDLPAAARNLLFRSNATASLMQERDQLAAAMATMKAALAKVEAERDQLRGRVTALKAVAQDVVDNCFLGLRERVVALGFKMTE
jgi:uncharacterized coiled-coil DUF342 family protein